MNRVRYAETVDEIVAVAVRILNYSSIRAIIDGVVALSADNRRVILNAADKIIAVAAVDGN